MLLADCYSDDTLTDVEETSFVFIFKRFSPASEEAAFGRRGFVGAAFER